MKSQLVKDLVHSTLGYLSYFNRLRVQYLNTGIMNSKRSDGLKWVHLGCGDKYIQDMINIDVNPFTHCDIWLDLRRKLPFESNSVDAIYCCHTLEHFYEPDVRLIIDECKRVLKSGAAIRIVTPDFQKAALAYQRHDLDYFSDFPDKRKSIGGRFANYLLCRDQHRLVFDFSFWQEILQDAGFTKIVEQSPHRSQIFSEKDLIRFEYEKPDRHHSVFVEAFK